MRYIAEKETGAKGFDIIIDDASHMYHLTKTCFSYLFDNYLKSGVIYVIEDWGTGYWQDWPDGHKYIGENHNFGLVKFVKELVDECGMSDITKDLNNNLPFRNSKIKSMTIYPGQVVIIKI